jgi:transcriptional regulator with XRE-family HTH domain
MDTKTSLINREIGRQIKREQSVSPLSVKALAAKTGISDATINRMWSKDPRDINITQITWLAGLMGTTPQELVGLAVEKVGGLGAIMAELEAAMSEDEATTDDLTTRRLQREAAQMSPAEIEAIAIAATTDAERRTDEPPTD